MLMFEIEEKEGMHTTYGEIELDENLFDVKGVNKVKITYKVTKN